jgi:lipopolysaccharide transport system permease protein
MNLKILTKEPFRDITIIKARSGWQLIDWQELWRYRDLFYFLVWRDIKRAAAAALSVYFDNSPNLF